MIYTLITLHTSGWTVQIFAVEKGAVHTFEHVTTLDKVIASVLYYGATPIRQFTR